ncbi:MAG: Sapep family Mn(2+)-dependent dipeptidase [Bifidobacterium crudilactis]|jgi:succinyl-diaminopimelate desuccinylase
MTAPVNVSDEERVLLDDADEWFDAHRQELVAELSDLVNIASVSDDSAPEPGSPYGDGVRAVFDHVLRRAADWGFRSTDFNGYAIDVRYPASDDGTEERWDNDIALVSHLDVVPEGDGWDWPAFEAFEKEGVVVGRGTADNKGAAIVDLFLLRFFNSRRHGFRHPLRVLLGGAEETTLGDMTYVVGNYGAPFQAVVTDSPFPVNNAQKGHLDVDVIVPAGPELSGFSAGVSYNSVPGHAAITLHGVNAGQVNEALNALDPELVRRIKVSGLGGGLDGSVELSATGITGHAAFPEGSLNAVWLLFKALDQAALLSGADAVAGAALAEWLRTPYGDGTSIAYSDDVSGRTTQNAGIVRGQGDELVVHFDIRYAVTQSARSVLAELADHAERIGGRLGEVNDSSPYFVDADDPRIRLLLGSFDAVMGTHAKAISMGGGTHARVIPNAINFGPGFIRGYVEGASRAIASPPEFIAEGKGTPHGADEWVSIEDLKSAFLVYVLGLTRLDQALQVTVSGTTPLG